MSFTVVAPYAGFPLNLDATDFSEAAKKAIKLNQEIQITSMIINDHNRNMRMLANVDYYNKDGHRKVGVKMAKTNALGYQGYKSLSPTLVMGLNADGDISAYLLPTAGDNVIYNTPGGPVIARPGAGIPAPPGTIPVLGSGAGFGIVGGPFNLPMGFPFGFGFNDSIESLEKKVKDLTASIAGKEAALTTKGMSASDADKYAKEKDKLAQQLASVSAKLAELKAKKAAK
jgi:hypothetical protein